MHEIAPKGSTSNLLPHIDNNLPVIDRNLSNLAPDRRLRSKGNHSTHRNLTKVSESLTKPKKFSFTPRARVAHIEEIIEEEEDDDDDEDDNVSSLAARTARLSEDQREQWIQEMNDMGIKFLDGPKHMACYGPIPRPFLSLKNDPFHAPINLRSRP